MDKDLEILANCFGALNVDLIDIRDTDSLEDAAYVCSSQVSELESVHCDKYMSLVDTYLDGTDTATFEAFMIEATNVDWDFDDETRQALRVVAEKTREGMAFYRTNHE
ncbi:MAG: hypothetical protein R3F38_19895 [Gammaproteobacteria bacterium]